MKKLLFVFLTLFTLGQTQAQIAKKELKETATLEMPGDEGSNGASVTWHPVFKKYYASFAGNARFPFAVFDAKYKRLSEEDLQAMVDLRGLWYNPITKSIEGNGYDETGWIRFNLDKSNVPVEYVSLQEGMVQPDAQSVGAYDVVKKNVFFLSGSKIVYYNMKGEAQDNAIELKLINAKEEEEAEEDELIDESDPMEAYNSTTACYTGIPNAEFAVLNITDKQIEMYNRKGVLTKQYKLPQTASVYSFFNFAYANGIWWFFDKDERKWVGYK